MGRGSFYALAVLAGLASLLPATALTWAAPEAVGDNPAILIAQKGPRQPVAAGSEGRQAQNQAQPPAAAPAPPPPPVPSRTEILNFENWTVTCREFAEQKKRECAATLQINQNNTNQTVFVWTIGVDAANKPISVFQTPTGVQIGPGVELKLEKAGPRKIAYTMCDNSRCTATTAVDGNLVRDMMAAKNAEVVIQAANGQNLQFSIPLKGFDKAYAALR